MVTVRWSSPASERAQRPTLLLFHGYGLDEAAGWELRHFLPADVVVASLRAPRHSAVGYSWFDLDIASGPAQADAAVADVLAWVDEELPNQPVGLLGFSQGGAAAAQLFRAAADRFDYLAILAGFVIPGPQAGDAAMARRRPPVLWSRGGEDTRIPPSLITSTRAWLQEHTTVDERVYADLAHNVSVTQLSDLCAFVARHARGAGSSTALSS